MTTIETRGHPDRLAERFEAQRGHLRAVAYRMLGSASEADDAVQEAWLRLSRSGADGVENLAGWLTTVVARVCLDMLRTRRARREDPLGPPRRRAAVARGAGSGARGAGAGGTGRAGGTGGGVDEVGGMVGSGGAGGGVDEVGGMVGSGGADPEHEALLADDVGRALLVVLDRLSAAERVAFVLHDLFAVPFDQIAPVVERSPVAAKKLASRARHRVHGAPAVAPADLALHRRVVDAFLAAARGGDLDGLLAVLAPDVVRRGDRGALRAGAPAELRGAPTVARETLTSARRARFAALALVDGRVGLVVAPRGRLLFALALTVAGDRITEIDVVADRTRLRRLDLALLGE